MPRKIPVTEETVAWLRNAVETQMPLDRMAAHIGCCQDTLKRILMRNSLASFSGAKFLPSRRHDAANETVYWVRRCLCCRTEQRMPKWKYICVSCKTTHGVGDPEEVMA